MFILSIYPITSADINVMETIESNDYINHIVNAEEVDDLINHFISKGVERYYWK